VCSLEGTTGQIVTPVTNILDPLDPSLNLSVESRPCQVIAGASTRTIKRKVKYSSWLHHVTKLAVYKITVNETFMAQY
jgi:hypothetical protein